MAQASSPVFPVSEMMKETGTTGTSHAVTSFSKRPDVAKFPVDDYDCLFQGVAVGFLLKKLGFPLSP